MSGYTGLIRNLVAEWRYDANLLAYTAMDQVGIHFKDDYSDWQRSALTLELRDKGTRRRFWMSHNRSFFHVVDPMAGDVNIEIQKAELLFEKLNSLLSVHSLRRVGLRQWAAFPTKLEFKDITRKLARKFQPENEALLNLLDGTIEDISYVAEVTHNEGWKYSLRLGPMLKAQWFEIVPHEQGVFESAEAFTQYKDAFPETFLFIDVDASKSDVPISDSKALFHSFVQSTRSIMDEIQKYAEKE